MRRSTLVPIALVAMLSMGLLACGAKAGDGNDRAGSGGGTDATGGKQAGPGGSTGQSGSGGATGSGAATVADAGVGGGVGGVAGGNTGSAGTGGPVVSGSGGAPVVGGTGGRAATGGATGATGGRTPDAGASTGGGTVVVTPPVPDTASTLGISAAGAAYHVEGNIPYGPLKMQRLDVIYPNAAGPSGTTTLPGVIMFHGGGWVNNAPSALKASMSSFFSRFLAHGFLVCNVEYRPADGTPDGAIAPAAVEDALLAAKWFWDHFDYYHVDRTRYVTTGASAGGHLALMVGMATPAAQLGPTSPTDYRIAAIVNGYGPPDVSDLIARGTSFAIQWLPPSVPDRAALAIRVSPITYARQDIPPLITVQGSDDTTVPVAENQNLDQALKAAGADADIHLVAGAGHGFTTPATAWPDAEKTMFDFLVAHGIGR